MMSCREGSVNEVDEQESIGEIDENDLDIIQQGEDITVESEAEEETPQEDTENQTGENATKRVVKPKRVIKNPQPKLNAQTLQEPKGLSALPGHFERVKFRGPGYEAKDLRVLLRTYEYWLHRLVPKFNFDYCIDRLERLGTKRPTQTQLTRIRMGLDPQNPDEPVISDGEENHLEVVVGDAPSRDLNDQFDQLLPIARETVPEITEEQMERIRQNRERAQRLRDERLRKIQEKGQSNLTQNNNPSLSNPYPAVNVNNTNCSPKVNENKQTDENKTNDHIDEENEEVNVENILEYINTDAQSVNRSNKRMLESDSEDDICEKAKEHSSKKSRPVIESDDDEQLNDPDGSNEPVSSSKVKDIYESDKDADIDTILTEINTDENIVTQPDRNKTCSFADSHSIRENDNLQENTNVGHSQTFEDINNDNVENDINRANTDTTGTGLDIIQSEFVGNVSSESKASQFNIESEISRETDLCETALKGNEDLVNREVENKIPCVHASDISENENQEAAADKSDNGAESTVLI